MAKFFSLEEVVGQENALRYLTNYVKKPELIPPLLIFHGPVSTGKWLTAERFIRQILCLTGDSCGNCLSCKLFMKNSHPDFIQFPLFKNIAIGDEKNPEEYTIRWLQSRRLPYKPHLSSIRIVLFPDASLINNEAETALLKSLEESPDHTKFIFIVDNLEKLKETIISRSILIKFNYLSKASLENIKIKSGIALKNYYGGSIKPYNVPDQVIDKLNEQILGRTDSTVNLLVLENWLMEYKSNHPDWTENFDFEEFLELFTLLLIYEFTKINYESNIRKIEKIFRFREELEKHVTNMENVILGKLFNGLMHCIN